MKQAKKIISLVLVAALLTSVCLIGGILNASAAATVIDEGNLLLNGGFEMANQIWNENSQKSGKLGFENREFSHGQRATVIDSWKYYDHWRKQDLGAGEVNIPEKFIYADQTVDAHSGNFALKLKNSGTGTYTESSVKIYPAQVVGDVNDYAEGKYRYSVWVKGTASGAYINYKQAGAANYTTVNITNISTDEWTQVVIENIAGFATKTNEINDKGDTETVLDMYMYYKTVDDASYIIFDDAVLEYMPKAEDNLNVITDGGFEGKGFAAVDTEYQIGHGHNYSIFDGWKLNYWKGNGGTEDAEAKLVQTSKDKHSGNYSYKITIPYYSNTWTANAFMYTLVDNENLEAGVYTLGFWTKGTNSKSTVNVYLADGTTDTITIPAYNEWTYISKDYVLTDVGLGAKEQLNAISNSTANIWFKTVSQTDVTNSPTELYIDDVSFAKKEALVGNGGFEYASNPGFTDQNKCNGQHKVEIYGWHNRAWDGGKYVSHITNDVHSGKYALKIAYRANASYAMRPAISNIANIKSTTTTDETTQTTTTTYTIPAGTYKYSVWVKGSEAAPKVTLQVGDAKTTFDVSTEWNKISVEKTFTEDYTIPTETPDKETIPIAKEFFISVAAGVVDTYVLLDDINLEKIDIDTIDEVKGQITGIKQPAVGATELELPVLDTNNDAITVSIAESSDENVIALDGTITTPKNQTIVDVTLKITDGTNEVTLDPIGVLVHGEYDKITQAVVDKSIADLDVKAETAADDIAQIDEWIKEKGEGYVSPTSNKMFGQKKLVYAYDASGDDKLDKDDIVAVREDLLGDETTRNIRDLITVYTKVIEYNSLAQ